MARIQDVSTDQVSLIDGETLSGQSGYVTVETDAADTVIVLIDDGSGGAPTSYDFRGSVEVSELSDWLISEGPTTTTARKHTFTPLDDRARVDLTCQSGVTTSSDTYRVVVAAINTTELESSPYLE